MKPLTRVRFGVVLLWRSLRVVASNRRLVVFPVLNWVAFVASAAGIATILAGGTVLPRAARAVPVVEPAPAILWALDVADPVVVFVLGAAATTYFNAATAYVAIRALRGERVSVRRGLFVALRSLDHVILWGAVASSVGVVFHLLERIDPTGRAVAGLPNGPWATTAFLVLPVIAFEDVPFGRLFERSRQLFRRSWGETGGASLGVDLVVSAIAAAVVGVVAFVQFQPSAAPTDLLTVAGVVVLAVVLLLRQLAVPVAKAGLYIYATTGRPPAGFDDLDFSDVSWRARPTGTESRASPEP